MVGFRGSCATIGRSVNSGGTDLTKRRICAHNCYMRRKPGALTPIERSILEVASRLQEQGLPEFHGFQIAKQLRDQEGARRLIGYGTLYRALARLQQQGLLQSRWEELSATDENRPRRRYYRLVGAHATAPSYPAGVQERGKVWGLGVAGV